jgi:transposase
VSPEDRRRARALALVAQGWSMREVARRLGMPRSTVGAIVARHREGREVGALAREHAARRARVLELVRAGWRQVEIAEEMGCSKSLVSRIVRDGTKKALRPKPRGTRSTA